MLLAKKIDRDDSEDDVLIAVLLDASGSRSRKP